jgi:hypothetical protein
MALLYALEDSVPNTLSQLRQGQVMRITLEDPAAS